MNRSSIDEELFEAAKENNVSEVRRLLSNGADVNANDQNGITALHKAIDKGHAQVVKELLDHGAGIEAKDNHGKTPLHCACWNGHLCVVNELLSPNESNGVTTNILGKRKSRAEANMEVMDYRGNTPLHTATRNGHLVFKIRWALHLQSHMSVDSY
jgi:ankyrin repeat protein